MSGRTRIKRFRIRRDSVPEARRGVEAQLTEWKLGGLIDVAALVTGELTTNVVQRARGTGEFFELGLRRRVGVLVIEVSDSFQWQLPQLRKAQETDIGGRGLLLVDALSEAWGVRPRDVGKTVWAHLPIHRRDLL
ncbi:ATP-binding protein [Streptomyces niveus]|uniref:ATP-binding protein n=1 Tax=Streptomyces niveus TaxID=193462 RepID=UPI0033FF3F6B